MFVEISNCLESKKLKKKKGKATHYRSGQSLRFPGVEAPRFQDNRHMKVVRSAIRPGHLYPKKYSWYSFPMVKSRELTQRDYQKSWLTGNMKEGKNEATPEEPGKMEHTQP